MNENRGIIWLTGFDSLFKSQIKRGITNREREEIIEYLFHRLMESNNHKVEYEKIYDDCLECNSVGLKCIIIANPQLPDDIIRDIFEQNYERIVFLFPMTNVRKYDLCRVAESKEITFVSMSLPKYEYKKDLGFIEESQSQVEKECNIMPNNSLKSPNSEFKLSDQSKEHSKKIFTKCKKFMTGILVNVISNCLCNLSCKFLTEIF